ncbi:DUF1223 domain-containing protein [Phreatobacter aquaticus]|uniref:DUF1223 domain-containing protein n=1 Tax=Phreatobacter aquaticus TaxID=2570229 RepID=A0A4D7QKY2_9HYPH|nr:DUF1223 domain-containing protein [Phreatobacter aquaticus]QCK84962.1 DUF1223 domain-containing protein [Phreatobacter aquaticus]
MRGSFTWGGLVAALVCLGATTSFATDRPRAVLELFTSQGCSSCPPADRYVSDMADRPDVIALTMAVDYWDYLGWRDTLADPIHSKRQKAYAAMRGDRQVYTPQMVVNGVAHVVGSDRPAIDRAITQSSGQPGVLAVPVNISQSGDTITVSLPTQTGDLVSADMPATVILLGVSSQETVDIVRGENRGQHVTYRNVVRSHAVLGEWTGGAQSYTVSRSARVASGCGRAVVLLQVGNPRRPGAMLGAAIARLQ